MLEISIPNKAYIKEAAVEMVAEEDISELTRGLEWDNSIPRKVEYGQQISGGYSNLCVILPKVLVFMTGFNNIMS